MLTDKMLQMFFDSPLFQSGYKKQLEKFGEDIDISAYDIIFLGYPNWCGTMPMSVWTFLENHDFGGKIVCPFCTNEGSGLANSIAHIDKLVPTADRKDGLAIKGSQVMESREILKNWIDGIGSF